MKVDGVWTAMPVSDTIAAVVAYVMMAKYMRKFKKQMSVDKQTS
jgi:Na+-driven multidrug efflux pump